MLKVTQTRNFLRDLKLAHKRGLKIDKLHKIVDELSNGKPLERKHHPHPLKGKWKPNWECHIEPDWLLIYEVTAEEVMLVRTGTHADLFD